MIYNSEDVDTSIAYTLHHKVKS